MKYLADIYVPKEEFKPLSTYDDISLLPFVLMSWLL